MEKAAEKAGKAAPVFAIAGALVASPQAQHATIRPATIAAQAHGHAVTHPRTATLPSVVSHGTRHATARAAARNIYYRVQGGDTIRNPNLIYTGETLVIPSYVPRHSAPGGYAPKHARTDAVRTTSSSHHGTAAEKTTATQVKGHPRAGHKLSGTLGYGNARAAVAISNDGTDWYPWTTYTSGAYHGRC